MIGDARVVMTLAEHELVAKTNDCVVVTAFTEVVATVACNPEGAEPNATLKFSTIVTVNAIAKITKAREAMFTIWCGFILCT